MIITFKCLHGMVIWIIFNERSFSREENGNLSRQMFIREGGLKHYTDIQSNNILTSLSVDYNLHRFIESILEFGYGEKLAFGSSGCIFLI